ncbi:Zinc/iron permease [Metarhizium album ARSEF 1941]|uniref:Zinc/iron permease n=1 Tax=Metarhizium album (strain ARSEF 1941) TaxID=1081103 RepID=A0A0B2X6D8_METAS|nr:Zinc/iron permease [Metarhizium album ARSEF 1941]KHO01040.1 Zinc/iron permease [Metarhizium album ARSEF 1941]
MHVSSLAGLALLGAATAKNMFPRQTAAPSPTSATAPRVSAITACHLHGSDVFCMAGETEYLLHTTPTQTTNIPAQFTGCHSHGSEMFCVGPDGDDVQVEVPGAGGDSTHQVGQGQHGGESKDGGHKHCHFHAGVEHCVGGNESEESAAPKCDTTPRDYDIGLRIGLLFVIMATSALGVFGPILLHKVMPRRLSPIFTLLKQFGTGIIISTAFVHLFTHASLMFTNKCIGDLGYEGTTSAILMAGIFLSFLVEYIGQRIVFAKARSVASLTKEEQAQALLSTEVVSILVMEAGILFHSLLIGLTLVVAGDAFFITLFIVILFHQVFEGLALGTRIATIGGSTDVHLLPPAAHHRSGGGVEHDTDKSAKSPTEETADASSTLYSATLSMKKKLGLAALFAFVTPIGMAIGIGVLHKFNGNDKSTIIAIGTLDALSAGILVWTGVVEMWAADWMTGSHGHRAELADANMLTVCLGGFGLVAGMAVMSFLGKWA